MRAARPLSMAILASAGVLCASCGSQSRPPDLRAKQAPSVGLVAQPYTSLRRLRKPVEGHAVRESRMRRTSPIRSDRLTPRSSVKSIVPPNGNTKPSLSPWRRLAVLQRPRYVTDRLPRQATASLERLPLALIGGTPMRPTTARLLGSSHDKTWLVSNDKNFACLVQAAPVLGSHRPGYSTSCMSLSEILKGWLVITLSDVPGQQGVLVEGIVPNGVPLVAVKEVDGRLTSVAVNANSYSIVTDRPGEVSYYLGLRRYHVPVPTAPRPTVSSLLGN